MILLWGFIHCCRVRLSIITIVVVNTAIMRYQFVNLILLLFSEIRRIAPVVAATAALFVTMNTFIISIIIRIRYTHFFLLLISTILGHSIVIIIACRHNVGIRHRVENITIFIMMSRIRNIAFVFLLRNEGNYQWHWMKRLWIVS